MIRLKPVPKMEPPKKKQKSKFQKLIKYIMIAILIASGREVFIIISTVLDQFMNVLDQNCLFSPKNTVHGPTFTALDPKKTISDEGELFRSKYN